MKKYLIQWSLVAVMLVGFTVQSCKNKSANDNTVPAGPVDTMTSTTTTAPTNTNDDALRRGVTDATKDYPTVTATVENGVITLNGSVERDRLPNLMQSLNSLNPQKINNNLTIK